METARQFQTTPDRILQLVFGCAPPLIIQAGVANGVFDALENGPKGVEEVSATTGASVRGLRTIMNAMVGIGLLAKDSQARYSLTSDSAAFLVSSKPGFLGGYIRHHTKQLLPEFLELDEIVQRGGPVLPDGEEQIETEFFEEFVEALFPLVLPGAQTLAEALGVDSARAPIRVLDLGAGSGVWGIALAQRSAHVMVTAVDWPGVASITRTMAARFGVVNRFRFVEGSLFEADFRRGYSIATLGHILHREGEQANRLLLKKTFEALAPGGTIVIAEILVDSDRTGPVFPLLFAVNMVVNTESGDTFSFGEISGWLQDAGFEDVHALQIPGPSPLILARKPNQRG
jgi:SAM-dependent methyltransferase